MVGLISFIEGTKYASLLYSHGSSFFSKEQKPGWLLLSMDTLKNKKPKQTKKPSQQQFLYHRRSVCSWVKGLMVSCSLVWTSYVCSLWCLGSNCVCSCGVIWSQRARVHTGDLQLLLMQSPTWWSLLFYVMNKENVFFKKSIPVASQSLPSI